ncbi:MAG TPA: beta-ketoacyl-ACP synthase II [Chloroflexia bacterium]|nr:beta-ketoacyl-ACP synthase II [Chloroflexia bacterium]
MGEWKRVVVTGMGVISPVGNTVEEAWASIINGRSGLGPITTFDASGLETRIAGEVKGFVPEEYIPAKEARRMDRFTQFAVAAASQALTQAGYTVTPENAADCGVIVGSGIGGILTIDEQLKVLAQKGPRRVNPFTIPMMLTDLAAGRISMQFGMTGPNFAVISACASGANSIGESTEIIRRGDALAMLCGGTEASILPFSLAAFGVMTALSTRNDAPQCASRPFEKNRDGFVLAEGAGILLLEERDSALQRGAPILAEILGYGATADASHVTAPAADGAGGARAMTIAMRKAGLRPDQIGYLNAHGTSTPLNEKFETIAIKRAFGEDAYKLPISSTKSMTGHLLGAAGGLEAVFCIKALETGILPPTTNYDEPDPDCDLDYIPNTAREVPVTYVMNNSMGFGGHNVSLILGSADVPRA